MKSGLSAATAIEEKTASEQMIAVSLNFMREMVTRTENRPALGKVGFQRRNKRQLSAEAKLGHLFPAITIDILMAQKLERSQTTADDVRLDLCLGRER